MKNKYGNEVDPEADWCPWCGNVRRWKGRHAAAKHPEKWQQFKDEYGKVMRLKTRWEKP